MPECWKIGQLVILLPKWQGVERALDCWASVNTVDSLRHVAAVRVLPVQFAFRRTSTASYCGHDTRARGNRKLKYRRGWYSEFKAAASVE